MSESVTWETCPTCRRCAAVGWRDEFPIQFDCPGGCRLSATQARGFAARRHPPITWLTRA